MMSDNYDHAPDQNASNASFARLRRFAAEKQWLQVVALLGFGVLTFAVLVSLRQEPEQLEPQNRIPLVNVTPAQVSSGPIRVLGGGTIRPRAEVSIAPEVTGRVTWVSPAFVSGARVSAGEVLLHVEEKDYQAALDAAEAEAARLAVSLLQAEEAANVAQSTWQRLAEREGLPSTPPNPLVVQEPQLEAARAALKSAEARLEGARLDLERTQLRAPFTGIVRDENAVLGQFATRGQSIGRIYATDAVEVVVALGDDDAALIDRLWDVRPGSIETRIPAVVTSNYGGVDYTWPAFVDRAESALDELTRTVDVVVQVPDPFAQSTSGPANPPLFIGSYANVEIEGTSFDAYATIPVAGLRDGEQGDEVWIVQQDTLLAVVPVTRIQDLRNEVIVVGDIADGTPVITTPMSVVTDGMTVQVEGTSEPQGDTP